VLENRPIDQYKWGYLTDFQVRLNRPEEKFRDVEDQNLNSTCIPLIGLPKWYNRLRRRQPVIIKKLRLDRSNTEYPNIIYMVKQSAK
jgi:hypothetical protein